MKKLFFVLSFLSAALGLYAQTPPQTGTRHKMAIFTPLYLDDAFDATGTYRFSTKSFPKNSIPGLEFYHGAQIAADSLNGLNIPLDIYVYDSKSGSETLEQQFEKAATNGVELIIANFTIADVSKYTKLAAEKKIILVNAAVPNDGNAKDNPYFIVLNTTLQTQIENIYHYLKTNYPSRKLVFLTRKSSSEDYIKSIFNTLNNQNAASSLSIKYVEATDSAIVAKTISEVDKTQPPIFVVGSLDTYFGASQLKYLASESKQLVQTIVIGMPTWENIPLTKPEYKGLEVIYSTPFYNSGNDVSYKNIAAYYTKKMFSKPSDLVYRAFGLVYRFGRMLNQYGKELNAHLDDKQFRMIYDYDFQPVFNNHHLDYFENKKVYFLKFFNGNLQHVN